jgi:hypothetical protein
MSKKDLLENEPLTANTLYVRTLGLSRYQGFKDEAYLELLHDVFTEMFNKYPNHKEFFKAIGGDTNKSSDRGFFYQPSVVSLNKAANFLGIKKQLKRKIVRTVVYEISEKSETKLKKAKSILKTPLK